MLASLLRTLRDHLFATDSGWDLSHDDADICPGNE
jgi:hypothetical protein